MRTKSRCMHGDEGALDGGGEDHVRDEQELLQQGGAGLDERAG